MTGDWFTDLVTGWVKISPMIGILLVLIGIDIFTGIIAAWISEDLNSATSWTGTLRKCIMLALVGMGIVLEVIYPEIPWGKIIAMFFCATEAISIMENAARSGVPLPKSLISVLQKMKEPDASGELLKPVAVPVVIQPTIQQAAPYQAGEQNERENGGG